GLQTQQTTANHYASFCIQTGCANGIQIFNSTINKAILTVIAWNRWHKSIRAGSKNQLVKTQHITLVGGDGFIELINFNCSGIKTQINAIGIGKITTAQTQILDRLAAEIFGQMYPIISQMWLFCQNGQLNVITGLFQYRFDEFMPHHAMPNHENFHICTPTIV